MSSNKQTCVDAQNWRLLLKLFKPACTGCSGVCERPAPSGCSCIVDQTCWQKYLDSFIQGEGPTP
ncbi:hypothetical protein FSP39_020951 [Pinctada imbricata]|uniref:Uncharacterized protein n=1 Tax=Pinctada imbricata TaxID=66713 RepID=A0AA88YM92_PINIB|nr:hypothetical protein FSP39_020951 [Pinctada imbricata]